jgi:hypothetical protein
VSFANPVKAHGNQDVMPVGKIEKPIIQANPVGRELKSFPTKGRRGQISSGASDLDHNMLVHIRHIRPYVVVRRWRA